MNRRNLAQKITNPNFRKAFKMNSNNQIQDENPYELYENRRISPLTNQESAMENPFGKKKNTRANTNSKN